MAVIKFEQHYYTHCHRGLSNTSGWQSKAKSRGINEGTQRLLETLARLYSIPIGNKQTDIENQPISFKSIPLSSGLWCISLTQYVGESVWQKGRWGVHFTHNLICSESDFVRIEGNPFHILRTGCFVKEYPSDRTELDVLSVEPQPIALTEALDALCHEFPDSKRLPDFLNALLFARSLKRPVIVVLPHEKIVTLMEGIICLLPLSIRLSTAFSTYERNPYSLLKPDDQTLANRFDFITCIVTPPPSKSDFKFTSTEYQFGYFIFNFEDGKFSEIPQRAAYSNWVCQKLFAREYSEIEACLQFMELHKELIAENINSALYLYRLESAVKDEDDEKVNGALAFARSHANRPPQIEDSLEKLLSAFEIATQEYRSKYQIPLITTALDIATKHPDDKWINSIYDRYVKLFKDAVEYGRHANAITLMKQTEKLPRKYRMRLPIDLTLNKGHLQYFVPLMRDALDLLKRYPSPDDEKSLYDAFLACLNASLDAEDNELSSALLDIVDKLPRKRQILLPTNISSTKGLPEYQIPLIGKAFDLLATLSE